jgi:hypothetical protein
VPDRLDWTLLAVPADAIPFDMRGAGLSHHGGDCSFSLRRHGIDDPVLWEIARIVHEAGPADDRYDVPVAPGPAVSYRGLSMMTADAEILAVTGPLFDGRMSTVAGLCCLAGSRAERG